MRLAAQAKGGYYPTPLRVVDLLAELIDSPRPTAGRGRPSASWTPAAGAATRWRNWPTACAAPTPCPWRPTGWN